MSYGLSFLIINLSSNLGAIPLLEKNQDKIDWKRLSSNPAAISLLEKNPNKINWKELSSNPAAISLLEANPDKIDWTALSGNSSAISLLEANPDKIDWKVASQKNDSPKIIASIQEKINKNKKRLFFKKTIHWKELSSNPAAVPLLEKNPKKIHWKELSSNPAAISLLEKNKDKINWKEIFGNSAAQSLIEEYVKNKQIFETSLIVIDLEIMCKNTNPVIIRLIFLLNSMSYYKGSGYFSINKYIKRMYLENSLTDKMKNDPAFIKGKEEIKQHIQNIDTFIKLYGETSKEPFIVYRGYATRTAEVENKISHFFMSSSFNYMTAIGFSGGDCCVIKYIVKPGVPFYSFKDTGYEQEILLSRGLITLPFDETKVNDKVKELLKNNPYFSKTTNFTFYLDNIHHFYTSRNITIKNKRKSQQQTQTKKNQNTPATPRNTPATPRNTPATQKTKTSITQKQNTATTQKRIKKNFNNYS